MSRKVLPGGQAIGTARPPTQEKNRVQSVGSGRRIGGSGVWGGHLVEERKLLSRSVRDATTILLPAVGKTRPQSLRIAQGYETSQNYELQHFESI